MSNIENLKQELINSVEANLNFHTFNIQRTELRVRCPYCGDSVKSEFHTHLYIQLNHPDILKFYCQRCSIGGYVDKNFLLDLGINDYNLIKEVENLNKNYSSTRKINKIENTISLSANKNVILPEFNNKKSSIKKLEYINSRYNFDYDAEYYIQNYKVVFSLSDFISVNKINFLNGDVEELKEINKNYIGFLSADRSYIIFRNIDPNSKQRYFNYNIFNDIAAKKFYIPSAKIDLYSTNTELILTEGIFDIIGVKEYFYKDNLDNKLFCAVAGKGYNFIINNIARLGLINLQIKIYSDKDVKVRYYKHLKNINNVLKHNRTEIFYNNLEKDYGVPIERIQLASNLI